MAGQARHQHDVAGNHHHEASPCGQRHVSHIEDPARWRAHELGLVRERVLRLGYTDCKPTKSPFDVSREFRLSLITQRNVRCAIDIFCNLADLLFEGIFERIDGRNLGEWVGLDKAHHLLSQCRRTSTALRKCLNYRAANSLLFTMNRDSLEFCGEVVGKTVDGNHNRHSITDRKSTRLNSSHLGISYAVFCL